LIDNPTLLEEAAEGGHLFGTFEAGGEEYEVVFNWRVELHDYAKDTNDADAHAKGYTQLWRVIARRKSDRLPVALREFYRRDDDDQDNLSKGIEVDHRFQRRRIAKNLMTILEREFPIKSSNTYTPAGAALRTHLDASTADGAGGGQPHTGA
jgi:hypothetical protein